jgi:hypothetical protein
MQKNSSENNASGTGKALKYVFLAFVAGSIGAVVYKTAVPLKAASEPAGAAAAALSPAAMSAAAPAVKAPAPAEQRTAPAEAKTAVVYYFYTNVRCSACKTIEAYTREAVETRFAAGYKGWKVEFHGVNLDEGGNKHFIQDYWLNSKSVIVQKFSGDKPLDWAKLDKVWQLLEDKTVFMNYVADETKKLLDEK